jgi:hypothetical protein
METVVPILMLFITIGSLLKISFNKLWHSILFGTVAAIFIVATYQFATLQSKTQLADYLQNSNIMQNIAVLVTLESGIMFAYDFLSLRRLFGRKVKRWIMLPLSWFPGLLIFPVLFFVLTQAIFSFPGVRFESIAWLMGASAFVLFPALTFGLKKLLPDEELRFEVHFIVTLFVTILGLICTVNGNVAYAAAEQPVDWKAIATTIGLFALAFVLGFGSNKLKWRIMNRIRNK